MYKEEKEELVVQVIERYEELVLGLTLAAVMAVVQILVSEGGESRCQRTKTKLLSEKGVAITGGTDYPKLRSSGYITTSTTKKTKILWSD